MTPEAQRIAIAEACGHKNPRKELTSVYCDDVTEPGYVHGVPKWKCDCHPYYDLPDYLNDLNAMHEAEKVLTVGQHLEYDHHLTAICGTMDYHATAAQRAEAFLRILGKWIE